MPAPRGTKRAAAAAASAPAADEAEDGAPPGGLTALHRWRSPPWAVAAVTAVAACPDGSAVAAAYENGRVEVWHLSHLCRVAAIPGWDGADLSSLAWARDAPARRWRLFAGSLDGAIYEVDFDRQQLVHASDAYGGAVWALASAPRARNGGPTAAGSGSGAAAGKDASASAGGHDIIAACDDGSLRVLRAVPRGGGLEYVRSLCKVEGKALAVAWHPEGRAVVSGGSDGCIHVWDPSSGRELLRITAAAASAAPPCVWALAVLPDGTIVSGDSDGATQFWEGRFGTLVSRLTQHVADVTAVAASADGALVYSAGVDPRVAVFGRVRDGPTGAERWAYLAHKSPHSHDVRALASAPRGGDAEELLLSGGVDGTLVAYPAKRILEEHPVRLTKAPQAPLLQLAPSPAGAAPRLLLAQGRRVTLWRRGRQRMGTLRGPCRPMRRPMRAARTLMRSMRMKGTPWTFWRAPRAWRSSACAPRATRAPRRSHRAAARSRCQTRRGCGCLGSSPPRARRRRQAGLLLWPAAAAAPGASSFAGCGRQRMTWRRRRREGALQGLQTARRRRRFAWRFRGTGGRCCARMPQAAFGGWMLRRAR